jgi:hypothetical protein
VSAGLVGHKKRFFSAFPIARKIEDALRSELNREPLFFFLESTDPDLRRTWFVLGRLGPEMEASLSIRGEVLMVFTAYSDFQRRSYNAIVGRVRQGLVDHQLSTFGNVRFSPDPGITLLYSFDKSALANVGAWNSEGARSLVAVLPSIEPAGTVSREEIAGAIARVLASRDLYRGKNPVTGSDFFGRSELIQLLTAELRAGRSIGLFGLRRSGKTSVLREMRRRSEPTGVVTVLSDLEALDDLAAVVPQLAGDLVNALRRHKNEGREVWIGPESEHSPSTFSDLSNRLVRVAEKNRELQFIVALDEIENLKRLSSISPESVRTFLGGLRRASQATENISLLFTGVTTEFFDQSMLPGDLDNPLFGFVDCHFLRPFPGGETGSLIRELGSLMMMKWDEDALDAVHATAGGFPFLVRDLASRVRDVAIAAAPANKDASFTVVNVGHVSIARQAWRDSANDLWKEIVRTLEAYHPFMAELVRCASNEELSSWVGAGGDAEVAAGNLMRLGLLTRDEHGSYQRAGVLVALEGLRTPEAHTLEQLKSQRLDVERLHALRSQPEGAQLEFKATSRFNLHSKKRDEAIEAAVVKTVCAFMNGQGGTLLIGVSDDGEIRGIAEDLALCRNSMDQYERWLCGDLLSRRLGPAAVSEHLSFHQVQVGGQTVVQVTVRPSGSVVWVADGDKTESLYVRNGNETRELLGRQIAEFISQRSGT